jgi:tRNA (guanosine-2'-O-)-methyltransferase
MEERSESKKSVRRRADEIRPFRCKNLIAVLENPTDVKNIGTVIRNVNALGVEEVYVAEPCPTTGRICAIRNRFRRPPSPR